MPKPSPLSPGSRFARVVDAWLHTLGTTKPAANTVAAYRRDLEGVARRIADGTDAAVLHLDDLTKQALRAAFASWDADHAAASVLRAHSRLVRLSSTSWLPKTSLTATDGGGRQTPPTVLAAPRDQRPRGPSADVVAAKLGEQAQ